MILPIVTYGSGILRKKSVNIDKNYPNLIDNMFDTLYNAGGVGLAAPQIGLNIKLFIIDGLPYEEDKMKNFKKIFINPNIEEESGEKCLFDEGCLSFPGIYDPIYRKPNIKINYYDENFNHIEENYSGILARIIQHEYDHLNGILFIDEMSTIKKRMYQKKLKLISKNKIDTNYKIY